MPTGESRPIRITHSPIGTGKTSYPDCSIGAQSRWCALPGAGSTTASSSNQVAPSRECASRTARSPSFITQEGPTTPFPSGSMEACASWPPGTIRPEITPEPGFRYDLATDTAVVVPLVVLPAAPATGTFPGGLPACPYFCLFRTRDSAGPRLALQPGGVGRWAVAGTLPFRNGPQQVVRADLRAASGRHPRWCRQEPTVLSSPGVMNSC